MGKSQGGSVEGFSRGTRSVGQSRLLWPDAAKGFCIMLVVIWHVVSLHFIRLDGLQGTYVSEWWYATALFMEPLRMPLFFAISGFFAAKAIRRSWRSTLLPRVVNNYYLHVVWLVIAIIVHYFVGSLSENRADSGLKIVAALATAFTGLWYMYALALYFVLAKAAQRWRPILAVMAGALVAVASFAGVFPQVGNTGRIVENFIYFLIGVNYRPLLEKIVAVADFKRVLISSLGFVCVNLILTPIAATGFAPIVELIVRLLAVWFGFVLFGWGAWQAVGLCRGLSWLGRRTLPIYVLHGLLLIPLSNVIEASSIEMPNVLMAGYPLLISLLLVVASLGMHRLLVSVRMDWLFAFPGIRTPDMAT